MTEFDPSDADDNTIAAEYVVGVLPLDQRVEAEARMRRDAAFTALVTHWQDHLSGFNSDYGTKTPPKRIKAKIDRDLFGTVRPWRLVLMPFLGAATAALFAVLLLASWGLNPSQPDFRAELTSAATPYQFVLELTGGATEAQMTLAAGDVPADQSFELWLLPDSTAPVSLGVFAPGNVFALPDTPQVAAGATLAVSLEPIGGSPTGAPTGPVIAIGVLSDA